MVAAQLQQETSFGGNKVHIPWNVQVSDLPSDYTPFGALYLHVPFCKQRCLYCDFATEAVEPDSSLIRTYTEQMILSLRRAAREGWLEHVRTVYIGGGTPTFAGLGTLTELLYTISLSMHLNESVECTVEANPDSLSLSMVRDLWALGANRISIGVQSFQDQDLTMLGRIHNADAARQAVECALDRFSNVSIDLICGLPGQTFESFRSNLETAVQLGVVHVSVYPLTIEEGTPLSRLVERGHVTDIDQDFQADCMELAAQVLHSAGFRRYEVANYAKPGFESKHNTAYWTGVSYLGLGPSAVSMAQSTHERVRIQDGNVVERLSAEQIIAEDLMLGMRMVQGPDSALVEAARRVFPDFETVAQSLQKRGLATWENGRFVPTTQGWLCGNELYAALLNLAP